MESSANIQKIGSQQTANTISNTPYRSTTTMRKQMIISVMSKDRPGIIASTTGAIYKLGGDVADLNQTVLCGYLTMILNASFEEDITKEDLHAAISHVKTDCKFEVSIKELPPGEILDAGGPPEDTYILTVQGPNRGGIVHGVSQFCFEHNVNIFDLATTLKDGQYTMALQLDVQKCNCKIEELQQKLDIYSQENGLTIMIQHNDIFRVTNEITLQ
ncbi:MAG: glycine cleavage system transcriptional repressor [Desulforhopalus sp.]|jgi:glycine cleavage system transcriptional repressor